MNQQVIIQQTKPINILPDELVGIVSDLYDHRDELKFVPLKKLLELRKTDLIAKLNRARENDDRDTALEIQLSYHAEVFQVFGKFALFESKVVGDLLFRLDEIIEFHQSLESGQPQFDLWMGRSLPYTSSAWTKLQLVLAADFYGADPDMLGLVVGTAWKDGGGQSILTSNFNFETCSNWLEASSQCGLNAIDPAPTKKIRRTLYRGGAFDPRLAHGMAWTEDKGIAKFFATQLSNETPIVVSTLTEANRVLVRYQHESEVVLPYDPSRKFEIEFV